jgi:Fe-S-cluster containining protein
MELRIAHPLPAGRVVADALLPFMHAVVEAAVDATAAQAATEGQHVSCRKGCAACCKAQPVPVTPPEAMAIARRVASQPGPRRRVLRERFADRERRLAAAGLRDTFLRETPVADPVAARAAAKAYHRLGLACPFLEDDACSIHAERPFSCRLYLVSSPPARCADPLAQPVAVLPMPLRPASALLRATEPVFGRPQLTVPLTLALAYAERHADELERRADARQTVERWLAAMT